LTGKVCPNRQKRGFQVKNNPKKGKNLAADWFFE